MRMNKNLKPSAEGVTTERVSVNKVFDFNWVKYIHISNDNNSNNKNIKIISLKDEGL